MQIFAKYLLAAMLIVAGIIHLMPITGISGVERINSLYGIGIADRNLSILMRHRAILFGLLGLFMIYAAFRPSLQFLALVAGTVSAVSFLLLAYTTGGFNEELKRIVMADVIAAGCLIIGFLAYLSVHSSK